MSTKHGGKHNWGMGIHISSIKGWPLLGRNKGENKERFEKSFHEPLAGMF